MMKPPCSTHNFSSDSSENIALPISLSQGTTHYHEVCLVEFREPCFHSHSLLPSHIRHFLGSTWKRQPSNAHRPRCQPACSPEGNGRKVPHCRYRLRASHP